ncbi:sporulation inhibitor of replication protein SirA [Ureibacillus chungkukjangi]|uniref:sporulation inhibitor of replication protein SirA n=1 Tax=Ureibacillus chungkukjangi TaxID=1202712 RepID=UPI00203DBB42|nr:sporulation inhibitor of replication protein SirA [Ureibacillus chungkukjangi]MCM3386994.1 sporulation inhibitor of replication protein SirA [Ureibacillus chungkukjangi]
MRIYSIFHIKKQYQSFVFGRERQLLEMVSTKERALESSVSKQLSYLCEPIEGRIVQGVLYDHLKKSFPTIQWVDEYMRFEHQFKGGLKIKVCTHHIEAICEGSRMLDLDLFHSLSQMNDSFIAFNAEDSECGWLKPIKHASY